MLVLRLAPRNLLSNMIEWEIHEVRHISHVGALTFFWIYISETLPIGPRCIKSAIAGIHLREEESIQEF